MSEERVRRVSVSYKRQVSDGNYGTEGAECYLEWFIDDEQDSPREDQAVATEMLMHAHNIVHAQLQASQNATVRRTVEPRTTASPRPLRTSAASVPTEDDPEELPF